MNPTTEACVVRRKFGAMGNLIFHPKFRFGWSGILTSPKSLWTLERHHSLSPSHRHPPSPSPRFNPPPPTDAASGCRTSPRPPPSPHPAPALPPFRRPFVSQSLPPGRPPTSDRARRPRFAGERCAAAQELRRRGWLARRSARDSIRGTPSSWPDRVAHVA